MSTTITAPQIEPDPERVALLEVEKAAKKLRKAIVKARVRGANTYAIVAYLNGPGPRRSLYITADDIRRIAPEDLGRSAWNAKWGTD